MAITFVNKSAFTSGTGALTVAAVASTVSGDVVLLHVHSANETIATPTGYTQVANSPQSTGTAAAAGGVRCAVFYKVLTAADTTTSVADSGAVTAAIKTAWRGVNTAAPINATAGSTQAATTSMSWPGLTTTAANSMIVLTAAQDTDAASTATSGALTNASLTSITERHDETVTSSVGGGLVVNSGLRAVAGTVTASTSTGSTSVTHAYVTVALNEYVAPATRVATLNITDAADAITFTGITVHPTRVATLNITDADDTVAATAVVTVSASLNMTEDSDVLVANMHVPEVPPIYHIDPDNGNDSNDGRSWPQAWKTARPIHPQLAAKPVPPGTEFHIKALQTALSDPAFTTTAVRTSATAYALKEIDMSTSTLAAHMPILIAQTGVATGWAARSGRTVAASGSANSNRAGRANAIQSPATTTSTVGVKEIWYTLPATRNLSSCPRLELRMSQEHSAAPVSAYLYNLNLCSDTLGDTPLLVIPMNNIPMHSGIFSYEGTLPDGVNSISITHGPALPAIRTNFFIQSIIATRTTASHPNYIGLYSAVKIGAEESASWTHICDFTNNGNSLRTPMLICTSASANSTPRQVFLQRMAGWCGFVFNISDGNHTRMQCSTTAYGWSGTLPGIALFTLTDKTGTASQPIVIRGGYDTTTDTVVGRSMLSSCGFDAATSGWPLISTRQTSYVRVENLEVISDGDCMVIGDRNTLTPVNMSNFRFQDCGLHSPQTASALNNATLIGTYSNDVECAGLEIVRCTGSAIFPTAGKTNVSTTASPGWVIEDSILTNCMPYSIGTAAHGITYKGIVKFYCTSGLTTTDTTAGWLRLPAINGDSTGRLEIYGRNVVNLITGRNSGGELVMPEIYVEGAELSISAGAGRDIPLDSRVSPAQGMSLIRLPSLTQWYTSGVYAGVTNHTHSGPLLRLNQIVLATMCPVAVDYWGVAGTNLNQAALISESYGGFQVDVVNVTAVGKKITPQISSTNTTESISPHIFRNITFDGTNFMASATTSLVFENVNVTATVAHNPNNIRYAALFKNSTITNVSTGALFDQYSIGETLYAQVHQRTPRAITIIDSPGLIDATVYGKVWPAATVQSEARELFPCTEITGGDTKIWGHNGFLENDATVFTTGPHSWRSTLQTSCMHRHVGARVLANVPLRAGSTVTISLDVRRQQTTSNFAGLIVEPGYTKGESAADCAPIYSEHTDGTGVWRTLRITYSVARSGMCLISFYHCGLSGSVAWYDTIRVVEG